MRLQKECLFFALLVLLGISLILTFSNAPVSEAQSAPGPSALQTTLKGDVNGDGLINLVDTILALQVTAGMSPAGVRDHYPTSGADVNEDNRIGPEETIYILQRIAGRNAVPVANAGRDQNASTGWVITLDGSGSGDADGDPLTYSWSFAQFPEGSTPSLSDSTVVNPAFTPDIDGRYVLSLIVNDGRADSTPDTVTINAYSVHVSRLPREIAGCVPGPLTDEVSYDYDSWGRLIGVDFTRTYIRNCEDDFISTEKTHIVFKGSHLQPIKQTDTFTYPEDTFGTIPTDRPHPIFSPTEIVTEYKYENPESPKLSEYQGSTTYVIVENLGKSGNITVMVKDCSIVFHIENGEKAKVTAHSIQGRPYLSDVEIRWYTPYEWGARQALDGDMSYGDIDIEGYE